MKSIIKGEIFEGYESIPLSSEINIEVFNGYLKLVTNKGIIIA